MELIVFIYSFQFNITKTLYKALGGLIYNCALDMTEL